MVTVSVPGKVHLMGEHAVVYGKPALLAAINKRLTVSVKKSSRGIIIHSTESKEYVRHIVQLTLTAHKITSDPDIDISISSEIPAGFHLGSSAAVAVAVIGALTYFLKKTWNPIAINKLAFEAEKYQHGNPSGGDNTIVTFGGIVWYRRELDFLKSIWQLPFRPSASLSHFMLVNTGKPEETTGDMVNLVKRKIEDSVYTESIEKAFHENEKQTKRIAAALKVGDEKVLIDAMKKGEQTLEHIGVVSHSVVPFIRSVETAGGSAKILGGGGQKGAVGYLLVYHNDVAKIASLCKTYTYEMESIILGEEGVRLDEK